MIDMNDVYDAILNEIGYCTNCMEFTTSPVKPEQSNILCEQCNTHAVFGASLALRNGWMLPEEND